MRTTRGRVVYNRPKHVFNIHDLERIARRITVNPDPSEVVSAIFTILTIEVSLISMWLSLLPWSGRFWAALPTIRSLIGSIWNVFVGNVDTVPKEAQGPIRLQGGLSLL
jgi:hypothetical protein